MIDQVARHIVRAGGQNENGYLAETAWGKNETGTDELMRVPHLA